MSLDYNAPELVRAHAKLNLALRVVGRRPSDNYHLLEMVNVELSLADDIVITRVQGAGCAITIRVTSGSSPGTPVAVIEDPVLSSLGRAFHLFCSTFEIRAQLAITITKRIPNGAGLGGGTADAAAILRWCWERLLTAELREQHESRGLLSRVAAQVGADVPYSLQGGCALVTGIGEEITPLPWALSGIPVVLVVPPISVATPEAFAAYRAREQRFSETNAGSLLRCGSTPPPPAELLVNDLESVVSHNWPPVAQALWALRVENARPGIKPVVGMTGSGSTVFCTPPSWSASGEVSAEIEQFAQSKAPEGCLIIPCHIR